MILRLGFMSDSALQTKWTNNYLESKILEVNSIKSRIVDVFVSNDNLHFVDQPDVVSKIPKPFSELLSRLIPGQEQILMNKLSF